MTQRKIVRWALAVAGLVLALVLLDVLLPSAPSAGTPAAGEAYAAALAKERQQKDAFLRTAPDSPVPTAQRAGFAPLPYFPAAPAWRLEAEYFPAFAAGAGPDAQGLELAGRLAFEVGGQAHSLLAYYEGGRRAALFVPFTDATTGRSTYGGGRYLKVALQGQGRFLPLDFNRAYHPYCVYDSSYVCPVPPKENRLPMPVEAGERLPG